jgi:CofD-related protein of GAK system
MSPPRTASVRLSRSVTIPDRVRLTRYRHAPELGVRPLFFSGGTALRGVSQKLIEYTHNSIHLITPFDSGGSSAVLRNAFAMPAVGDLRNRLMALADRSVLGHPEIYSLFAYRFPQDARAPELTRRLRRIVEGEDDLIRCVHEPLRSLVRNHLGFFQEAMSAEFDLRGANIGNLVLAGGYLNQGRQMDSVLFLFSQLVEVRGIVRPVVDEDLHLVARLASGRKVVGQHRLTGREAPPLDSPVESIHLTRGGRSARPYRARAPDAVRDLIRSADLVCYPMGSFYTSVLATLLPEGVAETVAQVDVPKVYVPNPGYDPEEVGLAMPDKVRTLLRTLRAGAPPRTPVGALLQLVLLDVEATGLTATRVREIERLGVRVVDTPLISPVSAPYLDDALLIEALLSLT